MLACRVCSTACESIEDEAFTVAYLGELSHYFGDVHSHINLHACCDVRHPTSRPTVRPHEAYHELGLPRKSTRRPSTPRTFHFVAHIRNGLSNSYSSPFVRSQKYNHRQWPLQAINNTPQRCTIARVKHPIQTLRKQYESSITVLRENWNPLSATRRVHPARTTMCPVRAKHHTGPRLRPTRHSRTACL